MQIIIITGLSGAGKTQAMVFFEDSGYYCVDNMPTLLIPEFVSMMNARKMTDKLVIVTDIRAGVQYRALADTITLLTNAGHEVKTVFLKANNETIVSRYGSTRRAHPLANECSSLQEAIAVERERMKKIQTLANITFDTSYMTTPEFKEAFKKTFQENERSKLHITCLSFGYQYGVPHHASFVLDVRALPNPYYINELRNLTGLDPEVEAYVMRQKETKKLSEKMFSLIDYQLSLYSDKKAKEISLAIGCSGGKHRSVTLVKQLALHLEKNYVPVSIIHRDIDK